jgi:hypothetical protein
VFHKAICFREDLFGAAEFPSSISKIEILFFATTFRLEKIQSFHKLYKAKPFLPAKLTFRKKPALPLPPIFGKRKAATPSFSSLSAAASVY